MKQAPKRLDSLFSVAYNCHGKLCLFVWLAGCLFICLFVWLVGWLVGWLAVCLLLLLVVVAAVVVVLLLLLLLLQKGKQSFLPV